MVGRGPRDQSSGQKPRARLPEVLACRAALRFKRANGREAGRAGLPRLLLNRGLNPFLGGVLDECGSEHSKSSRGHFFLKNDPRSLFGFHLPSCDTLPPASLLAERAIHATHHNAHIFDSGFLLDSRLIPHFQMRRTLIHIGIAICRHGVGA